MAAALVVAAVLVWLGISAAGNPIPATGKSMPVAALDIAVLVSREGLESTLVLATIVVGLKGKKNSGYKRPIQAGAALGFLAVVMTWFAAINVVTDLTVNYGALAVQATTGMIAVVVILIEMDWLVHGVYWSSWINMQNQSKRSLIAEASQLGKNSRRVLLGLAMIGFACVYREGFEVVLFLQSYYLDMGSTVVYYGAAAGLVFTLAVAYLTFLGQRRIPYKKMLVVTGVILTCVVFVMVGEEVNEIQAAGWIGTTNIPFLEGTPAWAELWFSIYPNIQTVVAQMLAMLSVAGTYFLVRYRMWRMIQNSKRLTLKASENV